VDNTTRKNPNALFCRLQDKVKTGFADIKIPRINIHFSKEKLKQMVLYNLFNI